MDNTLINQLWENFFSAFIEYNIFATYFANIERSIPINKAIEDYGSLSSVINKHRLANQKIPEKFSLQYMYRYSSNVSRLNESPVFRVDQMIKLEGNFEAYKFAIECNGNLRQITEELNDNIEILRGSTHRPEYQATGGPRIFIDAYIKTLKEIIQMIEIEEH